MKRYPLSQAMDVAAELLTLLRPLTDRIAVAGSVRRRRSQVKDLELLAIPTPFQARDMFGRPTESRTPFDQLLDSLIADGKLLRKRPNKNGHYTYGDKNKLLLHVPTGLPVDVFSTEARYWGMAMVVRTGPADFNKRLMSRFQEQGMRGHAYGGVSSRHGEHDCPEEEEVFRLAGWPYTDPRERR